MAYEIEESSITGSVTGDSGIELVKVNGTPEEKVWDQIIREYHYLGYNRMIGRRMKYLILRSGKVIGGISFNSASLRLRVRDEHIGWDTSQREKYLGHVVNNNRFLILPGIKVKNLASHVLSKATKQVRRDWKSRYGVEVYAVETFVDGERPGTCYSASNWSYLGETSGFSKQGQELVYHGKKKKVFFRILNRRFPKNIRPARKAKMSVEDVLRVQLQGMEYDPKILENAGLTEESAATITEKLIKYLGAFTKHFYRAGQCALFALFMKGIFSPLERKSLEPIALEYMAEAENGPRIMQYFFSDAKWDEAGAEGHYQEILIDNVCEPDGMITVDGCDTPKKGTESVGVARQHCGPLGKTENCQAAVMIGYSGERGYGLLEGRLYLPQKWFEAEYRERFENCKIPSGTAFKTKNEIAMEMIEKMDAKQNFQAGWVGADSAFGSDYEFLDSIPERYYYFADVKKNQHVFLSPGTRIPEYSGKGRRDLKEKADTDPIKVEMIAADPATSWRTVFLGEGSKGPIISREKCLRVYESRNGLPGREIWLYIRELSDGGLKYSISNAPADIRVEELRKQALRRWPIEQCFEECKRDLGMDHFEGRSWAGWHRHLLLVFIGHLFLLTIRKTFLHPDPTGTEKKPGICDNVPEQEDFSSCDGASSNTISPDVNMETERGQLLAIIVMVEMPLPVSGKPILTLPQARDIVFAALKGDTDSIVKELKRIRYLIKKAVSAQKSHRKTKIAELKERVAMLEQQAA
ncbi:MAG: IS701 family transposase [Treponema sp.]|jgi:SRSO17 transposase|nr:IS701 family transposase [Treponema sp.]